MLGAATPPKRRARSTEAPLKPSLMSLKIRWSTDLTKAWMREVYFSQPEIEEYMLAKEARSNFKADVRRFLSNLVNFSLYVKKSPPEERKEIARKFLNNMNGWIYRRKLNQKKIKSEYHHYLCEGILFPFSPRGKIASTLIVRVVHSDVTVFETKTRAPYRMVIETIEYLRLNQSRRPAIPAARLLEGSRLRRLLVFVRRRHRGRDSARGDAHEERDDRDAE